MRYGVTAAQEILVLFVEVRIFLSQQQARGYLVKPDRPQNLASGSCIRNCNNLPW